MCRIPIAISVRTLAPCLFNFAATFATSFAALPATTIELLAFVTVPLTAGPNLGLCSFNSLLALATLPLHSLSPWWRTFLSDQTMPMSNGRIDRRAKN